eukprot:Gb_38497 [translate_table: standard]
MTSGTCDTCIMSPTLRCLSPQNPIGPEADPKPGNLRNPCNLFWTYECPTSTGSSLVGFFLLPDRKLKYLAQESLHDLPESRDGSSLLLFWYWEDCLKRRFERFVVALEDASKDTLPFLKDKALKNCSFEANIAIQKVLTLKNLYWKGQVANRNGRNMSCQCLSSNHEIDSIGPLGIGY